MKRVRKLVSLALALCLVSTAIFTGCKAKTDNGATADTSKKVTLKWVLGGVKQQDSDKVWAAYNDALKKYLPNTTVEFEAISMSEYDTKWALMASSGEQIDLAWFGWMLKYPDEINKGAYLALDDYIDKYAPDMKKELPSWVLDIAKYNGKIYSIPCYQQMISARTGIATPKELSDKYWPELASAQKVWYSGTSATQADYDQMAVYLQRLKDNNALGKGTTAISMTRGYYGVYGDYYVKLGDSSYKIYHSQELPDSQLYYKNMADWYQKGYIRKDILTDTTNYNGKGNSMWADKADVMKFASDQLSTRYGIPVVMTDYQNYWTINGQQSNTSTCISAGSKNPVRSMQLLNLMNSAKGKQLINLLAYGIEGQDYTKVSDNRIKTIGYDSSSPDAKAPYGISNWAIGNTFDAYETQADIEGMRDYVQNTMHAQAKKVLVGFKFDSTNVQTQVTQYNAVTKQYNSTLINGVSGANWKTTYDEFIAKMKTAGSDQIQTELQKQVDAFVKANKLK